jgi:hypothetical protein
MFLLRVVGYRDTGNVIVAMVRIETECIDRPRAPAERTMIGKGGRSREFALYLSLALKRTTRSCSDNFLIVTLCPSCRRLHTPDLTSGSVGSMPAIPNTQKCLLLIDEINLIPLFYNIVYDINHIIYYIICIIIQYVSIVSYVILWNDVDSSCMIFAMN